MPTRLCLCAALLAAGACTASAAPPVRVSLVRPLVTPVSGTAWAARLAVRPGSFRGRVRVTANGPRRLAATAVRSGGSYRVRLVFPVGGKWSLTAQAGGSTSRLGSVSVRQAPRPPLPPLVLTEPTSIAYEPAGTLLVVENGPGRALRVNPATGRVDVLASSLPQPYAVARAPSGAIYLSVQSTLRRIDGPAAVTVAEADSTIGPVAVAANGDVYYATATRVFRLPGGAGTPVRVAGTGVEGGGGDGLPALEAQLAAPHGLAVAADGAVLVGDTGNDRVRRIDPATGVIAAFASVRIPDGMDTGADGSIYVVDGNAKRVVHLTPSGERIGFVGGTFAIAYDVAVAPDGVVYVLEAGPSGRIKRVARDGTTTTVARG